MGKGHNVRQHLLKILPARNTFSLSIEESNGEKKRMFVAVAQNVKN
jgi:hypothetical protein